MFTILNEKWKDVNVCAFLCFVGHNFVDVPMVFGFKNYIYLNTKFKTFIKQKF